MINPYYVCVLIIILLIIILVVVIVIVNTARKKTLNIDPTNQIATIPMTMGKKCDINDSATCTDGYECDPTYLVCKKSNNQICTKGSECLTDSYCSGICTDITPAYVSNVVGDPCPCPTGMVCTKQPNMSLNVCKKQGGIDCTYNSECSSNKCSNMLCASGKNPGETCTPNSNECLGGYYCDIDTTNPNIGYCQPNGISNGEVGASCTTNTSLDCDAGLSCYGSVCIPSTQGLGDDCTVDSSICTLPLTCTRTSDYNTCQIDDTNCVCTYTYTNTSSSSLLVRPDPNKCGPNSSCTSDVSVCTGNICTANVFFPCVAHSNCSGVKCGSTSYISSINFGTYTDDYNIEYSNMPNTVNSSVGVKYIPITTSNHNWGTSAISKLTGYSDSNRDYIYYVVPYDNTTNSGRLYDINGNIICSSDITKTLVDADVSVQVNNGKYTPLIYAIYKETINGKTTNNLYQYDGYAGTLISLGSVYSTTGSLLTPTGITVSNNNDIAVISGGRIYVTSNVSSSSRYELLQPTKNTLVSSIANVSKAVYYSAWYNGDANSGMTNCGYKCNSKYNLSYTSTTNTTYNNYNLGQIIVANGSIYGYMVPTFVYVDDGNNYIGNSKENVIDYSSYTPSYGVKVNDTNGYNTYNNYINFIANIIDNTTSISTNVLLINILGNTVYIPGYVSAISKVLVLEHGFYIYHTGACGH